MYQFIPLHSCDYLCEISVKVNLVTDESNDQNETLNKTELNGLEFKSHSNQLSMATSKFLYHIYTIYTIYKYIWFKCRFMYINK